MSTDTSRLVALDRAESDDVTVYVKGFLAPGEAPEHFDHWHRAHRRLAASHGWGATAHGWTWPSGQWLDIPIPLAGGTKLAVDAYRAVRHARVAALGATVGLMVAEVGVRFLVQYLAAERRALEEADALAAELGRLARTHRRVRVVAHSLGCRQVIAAVAALSPTDRPSEIHLCAPALVESDVADRLDGLARRQTFVYYCADDLVLALAFGAVAWDRALGIAAPAREYRGLVAVDVREHFGFRVHGEYKNRFAQFAGRPSAEASPVPGPSSPAGSIGQAGSSRQSRK